MSERHLWSTSWSDTAGPHCQEQLWDAALCCQGSGLSSEIQRKLIPARHPTDSDQHLDQKGGWGGFF